MLVVSASVVFTVVILNLHFRTPDTHEMSPLVGTHFLSSPLESFVSFFFSFFRCNDVSLSVHSSHCQGGNLINFSIVSSAQNQEEIVIHTFQLSKVLLEFLPWILMMSRPGHRFYNGGCYKEHKVTVDPRLRWDYGIAVVVSIEAARPEGGAAHADIGKRGTHPDAPCDQ